MKHTIFFDLDDTLIMTQELYERAKKKIIKFLLKLFPYLTEKEIKERFSKIDKENVKRYGFSPERFPTSWKETFEWFAERDGNHSKDNGVEIYEIAKEVFISKAELYPESIYVLEKIKEKGYELCLLTAGDEEIQNKRIDEAEIRHYFNKIHIVPLKMVDSVREIINDKVPSSCIMIGNSLKSDIHPSLEIGMNAIHVEADTWAYDEYQVDKTNEKYQTSLLNDVPETIEMIVHKLKIK